MVIYIYILNLYSIREICLLYLLLEIPRNRNTMQFIKRRERRDNTVELHRMKGAKNY